MEAQLRTDVMGELMRSDGLDQKFRWITIHFSFLFHPHHRRGLASNYIALDTPKIQSVQQSLLVDW